MRSTISILRGAASTLLFVVFGLGALAISPLVLLLGALGNRPLPAEWGLAVIRFTWRPLVFLFQALGLIRIERNNIRHVRGAVIVANHPSLIDVVLLTVLIPNTFAVAKHALLRNPFLSILVRKVMLRDDARFLDVAQRLLARGCNVLIFPEGTRSPAGGLHPFRRGAVQLALRAHAPLVAIGIVQSERILGKGQRPWQLGSHRVTYAFHADRPWVLDTGGGGRGAGGGGTPPLPAVKRLTAELEQRVRRLMGGGGGGRGATALPAAVIPVYNPEPDLIPLCEGLVSHFSRVIVVDDGSIAHVERFHALPPAVTLLRHAVNRGKGAALKTALRALGDSASTVVFADGDGQHRLGDILAVARRAEQEDAVVFGVRDFRRASVPFRSWWGNRWTAWEVRLLFGFALADTQTGLRAIPARLLHGGAGGGVADLPGDRYEFEARLFKFLLRCGEPILQVPIETVYAQGNRSSHFRPFVDTLRTQAALVL